MLGSIHFCSLSHPQTHFETKTLILAHKTDFSMSLLKRSSFSSETWISSELYVQLSSSFYFFHLPFCLSNESYNGNAIFWPPSLWNPIDEVPFFMSFNTALLFFIKPIIGNKIYRLHKVVIMLLSCGIACASEVHCCHTLLRSETKKFN